MKNRFNYFLLLLSMNLMGQPFAFNPASPPSKLELVSPGIISTFLNERDFALSPDQTEIFYTLQTPQRKFQTLLYSKKLESGLWSPPEIASFSGQYSDLEPFFSVDGTSLFFSSNRPVTGHQIKDFDIWKVEKTAAGWMEPKNLGPPINTELDEFYPSVSQSGNLYFTAAYKTAIGKEDIFISKMENGSFQPPVPLDTAINSITYEFNAYVSPDESFLIFTSFGRKDDQGRGDLYVSIKSQLGHWLPAKNISFLNSDQLDFCPFVSSNGKVLFLTSERSDLVTSYPDQATNLADLHQLLLSAENGSSNIYWIDLQQVIDWIKKANF